MPFSADALLSAGLAVELGVLGAVWRLASRTAVTDARLAAAEQRLTDEQARHAEAIKAQVAPVANGFAKNVKDSLARIEAAQIRQDERLDRHLEQHNDTPPTRLRSARGQQ